MYNLEYCYIAIILIYIAIERIVNKISSNKLNKQIKERNNIIDGQNNEQI